MTSSASTREQIEAFLAEPRNAMIAAIRRDGRPQMTPNWFLSPIEQWTNWGF
jgi:hypothetical protein